MDYWTWGFRPGARGGGYAGLSVGPWSVRDAHGSASIKAAVAALETLPGLKIERRSRVTTPESQPSVRST